MKKSILIAAAALLLTAGGRAAVCDLSHGQDANAVLGQTVFTVNAANDGGASASTAQGPRKAFSDGTRLFLADTDNNRVLIWNTLPATTAAPADLVLGQADFTGITANRGGAVAANTLNLPHSVFFDGTRLLVADYFNNRVLVWNSLPTVNGQSADLVLGQADFSSGAINRGAGELNPSANSLHRPAGAVIRDGKLLVADTFNHRLLIWNSLPAANGQNADVVVGQTVFTANTSGCSSSKFHYPHHVDVYSGRMVVSDTNNSRAMVFNTVPTTDGAAANIAIGKAGLTACGASSGASGTSWVVGTTVDPAGDLWLVDYGNHRVLRYSGIPASSGASANLVLGQADFSGTAINRTGLTDSPQANSMYFPYGVTIAGGKVYVNEASNNRVLIFDCPAPTATPTVTVTPMPETPCPLVNSQSAILALGQPDLISNAINNGGVSASSLHWPYRLASDGTRLIVPDANNHRVLIWNTLPSSSAQPADVVLGQADFVSNQANRGGAVAANTLNYPSSASVEGGRLVVADYSNNRVLIWNSIPTVNGQAADVVVGQADFTSGGINRGAGIGSPQANSLYQSSRARIIGGKLFVLDAYNHRVLIYNTVPTANSVSADLVLGQASFTTNSLGTNAGKLHYPNDVESDGTRLWVVDANNNRVLGWSSFPTVNGQAANFVLGQTTLTSTVQGAGPSGLYAMNSLLLHDGDLFVSDYGNNRVLRYSPAPSSSTPAADLVLGQSGFSGTSANRGASVGADTLSWPYGLAIVDGALWVTDMGNHRVLKYACLTAGTPTATVTQTATFVSTYSATPTATRTLTPAIDTPTATATVTQTATFVSTYSATPTATRTPTPAIDTPTATATVTQTATFVSTYSATPTATRTPTANGPVATATAVPTKVKRDDKRVECFPNYVRGRGQVMKILARSYSGGQCSLKVNRPNGRVLGELWKGYLAPQEIKKQDWDTKDSQGAETPSGVYYVVFTDGDGSIQVQKVLIVR